MKKTESDPYAAISGTPIAFRVFTEIAIIAHLADNAFAKLLPKGLTTAQFGVLNHLVRTGRSETISEIAEAMQVAQPTMSSTVKRLERKGLVALVQSAKDARVREVTITRAGRALREEGVGAANPLRVILDKAIAARDWKTALPILERIRQILDANR